MGIDRSLWVELPTTERYSYSSYYQMISQDTDRLSYGVGEETTGAQSGRVSEKTRAIAAFGLSPTSVAISFSDCPPPRCAASLTTSRS